MNELTPIEANAASFLTDTVEPDPPPSGGEARADAPIDRSPYLVRRLLETRDENLFNHVKFHLVKRVVDALSLARPRVLDIGCGLQVAGLYLDRLGLDMDYFGVDYEPRFRPDAIVDLAEVERIDEVLPWAPDVVLLLDVLEHLHEDRSVLSDVVTRLAATLPPETTVVVTLPQMYRLDRFKLAHLHYPEHKIRLTQREWREVLESGFEIRSVQGLGYLSVLPYLPMASRRYAPDNRLGRLFAHLRGRTFEWAPLKPIDLWLSNTLGRLRPLQTLSNDVLFVASPRRASASRRAAPREGARERPVPVGTIPAIPRRGDAPPRSRTDSA